MAYTAEQQEIYDWIRGSLPKWFTNTARTEEDLGALVVLYGLVREQVAYWRSQAAILTAVGATGSEPDWLAQHAKDRGSSRASGETDAALRERLRSFEDTLTRGALLALMGRMMTAASLDGDRAFLVELRRDRAFFLTCQQISGTGSSLAVSGSTVTLTTAASSLPGGMMRWMRGGTPPAVTIAGATTPANNGTFLVTGFVGASGIQYVNASAVAEAFPGTWALNAARHNRKDAYLSRGYRMTGLGGSPGIIGIIGDNASTEAIRLAVLEALRQRKAAGIAVSAEREH
jgi:hypothetical protein